jgi:8-oxo-dGTP diphosphatase
VTIVVAAVIERGGRILIGQRKNAGHHPFKWEFPGGKVEPDETPEAATSRELEEELAIRARVDRELMRYQFQYAGRPPILLIFYRIVDFEGEPENRDFEQIRWELPERLASYDFLEGDADFLRSLRPPAPL